MKKTSVLFGLLALFGVNGYSQPSMDETEAKEVNATDSVAETSKVSYDFIYESNNTDTCVEANDLF